MKTVGSLCLLAVIAALLAFLPVTGPLFGQLLLWLLCFLLYFTPSIVAYLLRRSKLPTIIICNALFGWTFVGWIALLVFVCLLGTSSAMPPNSIRQRTPRLSRQRL